MMRSFSPRYPPLIVNSGLLKGNVFFSKHHFFHDNITTLASLFTKLGKHIDVSFCRNCDCRDQKTTWNQFSRDPTSDSKNIYGNFEEFPLNSVLFGLGSYN